MKYRWKKGKLCAMSMILLFMIAISGNTAHAKGKQLKVTKSKSTLYVLDVKNNASQIKVKYGKKNVTKACKYSITNKKIATVNKAGKITAVKTGTATIRVKYKKKKK